MIITSPIPFQIDNNHLQVLLCEMLIGLRLRTCPSCEHMWSDAPQSIYQHFASALQRVARLYDKWTESWQVGFDWAIRGFATLAFDWSSHSSRHIRFLFNITILCFVPITCTVPTLHFAVLTIPISTSIIVAIFAISATSLLILVLLRFRFPLVSFRCGGGGRESLGIHEHSQLGAIKIHQSFCDVVQRSHVLRSFLNVLSNTSIGRRQHTEYVED